MMITILGTGLLGSGFARAFMRKGHSLRVWNRTAQRARPLSAEGAIVVADPAEAVRGVERVHLVLADDEAVDCVLAAAAPGLAPGVLVLDHSTTSPGGACERTARWRERNVTYVHAPVFMGPQSALDYSGLILVSGDRSIVARVTPLLAPMTGKVVDVGPRVEQAAAFKLMGNLLMMSFIAGFADMLALAKAMNITPTEATTLFEHFDPGPSLARRFKRIAEARNGPPTWGLAMARKDARLMQAEADRAGMELRMLTPLAELMDVMLARGFGEADWTVVAKDLVDPD
jgi:3-hydroxyisobutyrate dehydrogenase